MAKLSARGRYALRTYEKEITKTPEQMRDQYDTTRERLRFNFMSDGHILYQLKVWWSDGHDHLYPWKDKGKSGIDSFEKKYSNLESKGYKRIDGGRDI